MISNASGGSRILGSLRAADGEGVVRVEDHYDTAIDDLWSALTDPRRLADWHGEVSGELRPGGKFRVYLEADDVEATGRVEICDPPHRLVVTTRDMRCTRLTFSEVVVLHETTDPANCGASVASGGRFAAV